MDALALLRTAVFVSFFVGVAIAIRFHQVRWVRAAFLTCFVAASLAIGFTGGAVWPFFGWGLYGERAGTVITYHEIRIADAAGREIKIDARAVPPSMATPLNRFAARFPGYDPMEAQEFAEFLIDATREYARRVVDRGRVRPPLWKFPPHQHGFQWTRELLAGMDEFEEVRIYRVEASFSEDGTELLSRDGHLVQSHRP